MVYSDFPLPEPLTIDSLSSRDIMDIVLRELMRYGVPAEEWGDIIKNYINPLRDAVESVIRKHISETE